MCFQCELLYHYDITLDKELMLFLLYLFDQLIWRWLLQEIVLLNKNMFLLATKCCQIASLISPNVAHGQPKVY